MHAARLTLLLVWSFAATSISLVTRAHAQSIAPGVSIDPARPAWALPEEPLPAPIASDGSEVLTREAEWHVDGAVASQLARRAYVMHTAASVAERSEIEIPLAAGERLALLGVRRVRDGVVSEILRAELVRAIQPEERFDDGIYDESRRVLVFLEDVRPGDTIDYAYVRSVPLARYGGRFVTREMLEGEPSRRVRFVARWPATRSIAIRAHSLDRTSLRLTTEPNGVRIEGEDTSLPRLAFDAPSYVDPLAWVELSEFATWDEVAAWAEPHFRATRATTIDDVPLDAFRALPTESESAQAALRFVQDEVRYLGIEVEERALFPSAPDVVARRRYGDCKDKALLLVAILRALDIDATVALVDSVRGRGLDDDLASPLAFDHAVVRARVDGREVWMDATRSYEREPIGSLPPLTFERALLVAPDTTQLVPIPMEPPSSPDSEIEEHYDVRGRETLTVDALFRRREAAEWRATIAGSGLGTVSDALRDSYAESGLAPEPLEAMTTEERDDGALVLHVRFAIRGFWNAIERDISAWSSLDVLPEPVRDRPALPLAIPFPRFAEHRVRVDAERWTIEPGLERVTSSAFDVTRAIRVEGRTLRIVTQVRTLSDHVEADELSAYERDRERARNTLGYAVFIETHPESATNPTVVLVVVVIVVVLVAAMLGALGAVRSWWSNRRRRRWRSALRGADGESPATAIEVSSLDEAQRKARAMTCCGMTLEPRWTRAQLGGAPAFVQSATCPTCERTQRRYFRARLAVETEATS